MIRRRPLALVVLGASLWAGGLGLATGCSRSGLEIPRPELVRCDGGACDGGCSPGARECRGEEVWACVEGTWVARELCSLEEGLACGEGACVTLCDDARAHPSQLGCRFWSVDLDQLETATGPGARLEYGVAVANPWAVPVRVAIERNDAMPGERARPVEVLTRIVPPLAHEEIALPRRDVDRDADGVITHTALTSRAYRISSTHPVTIVQANPLVSTGYSRDTSLLLPSEMLGLRTTVVGWPQTLADGDTPDTGYDTGRDDEDARAFLTIVGTEMDTHVEIRMGSLGPPPAEVVAGGPIPRLGSREQLDVMLGPFDVLNLETRGLNADLTGTVVEADAPVAVFVGSEASDAPRFDTYRDRICCADHLEEQLWPDRLAGREFVIGRQPSRRTAIARAGGLSMLVLPEPEWLRIVAVEAAELRASEGASIPARLAAGEDVIVRVDGSFELVVTNGGRVHAMSVLASQDVIGVRGDLPGGDPSITLVPPIESHARSAPVLVPDGSFFDFVTITAPSGASVLLDGSPLEALRGPDGLDACRRESTPRFLVHQCQLAFPRVAVPPMPSSDGQQDDGLHLLIADRPIGVTVSGFQRYIGYAHPGAMRSF